jgi:glycosyltransferase involved in cell wall biosynthesis
MDILLSFIIPNLNSGVLLEQTINSIITKEFECNYEVIIVDGLSSDESVDFLNDINHKNLRLSKGKDVNVYDAMNKGISLARGEWLMFLGAGDTITDSLPKIYFESYSQFRLIYGNVFWVSKNLIYDGLFTLKKLFYKNICQQAILYNRKCFDNFSFFNLKYFINADYEFNLNIFIEYSMKTLHQICLYYFVLLYFDLESISYILYIFSSIYTHEI